MPIPKNSPLFWNVIQKTRHRPNCLLQISKKERRGRCPVFIMMELLDDELCIMNYALKTTPSLANFAFRHFAVNDLSFFMSSSGVPANTSSPP